MISMMKRQGSTGKTYAIGRVHLKKLTRDQWQETIVSCQLTYPKNALVLEQNVDVMHIGNRR